MVGYKYRNSIHTHHGYRSSPSTPETANAEPSKPPQIESHRGNTNRQPTTGVIVDMHHNFIKATFDPSNYKTYDASCHCGAVRLIADVSPPLPPEGDHEVVTCNCAMPPPSLIQKNMPP